MTLRRQRALAALAYVVVALITAGCESEERPQKSTGVQQPVGSSMLSEGPPEFQRHAYRETVMTEGKRRAVDGELTTRDLAGGEVVVSYKSEFRNETQVTSRVDGKVALIGYLFEENGRCEFEAPILLIPAVGDLPHQWQFSSSCQFGDVQKRSAAAMTGSASAIRENDKVVVEREFRFDLDGGFRGSGLRASSQTVVQRSVYRASDALLLSDRSEVRVQTPTLDESLLYERQLVQ